MKPTPAIPYDADLPGLTAIRVRGLKAVMPALSLRGPVNLLLRGYTEGKRAILEAQCGERRLAIKASARDVSSEVQLYQELAARGLAPSAADRAAGVGVRVPPLLAWDRELQMFATGWLEGPTANDLIKAGNGERAGELTSRWFRRTASLPLVLGPSYGALSVIEKTPEWVSGLLQSDPMLGAAARTVAGELASTPPPPGSPGLVHGTLYTRHVIDAGGPGLIDWDGFGHGPLEFDAGVFLATVWRIRLSHPEVSGAVTRAEQAFMAGTAGRLDGCALSWYRAAALLHIAYRLQVRSKQNWKARALALLSEAGRLAVTAAA